MSLTRESTRYKRQATRQLYSAIVCHKTYIYIYIYEHYKKLHQRLTFSLLQVTYNPFVQQASHSDSLPNIPPFYLPLSSPHPHPLPMRVAFICLLVDCVPVRMAVGINDCRNRVVLLRGILNLSLLSVCLSSNSRLSGCVSSAQQNSSVCH